MANKWIQLMSADGTDNLFPTTNMDLLWTNASPTSSFSAQTISLDTTGYEHLVILTRAYANQEYYQTNILMYKDIFFLVSQLTRPDASITGEYKRRTFKWTTTGIDVSKEYYNDDSSSLLPYQIYGIK